MLKTWCTFWSLLKFCFQDKAQTVFDFFTFSAIRTADTHDFPPNCNKYPLMWHSPQIVTNGHSCDTPPKLWQMATQVTLPPNCDKWPLMEHPLQIVTNGHSWDSSYQIVANGHSGDTPSKLWQMAKMGHSLQFMKKATQGTSLKLQQLSGHSTQIVTHDHLWDTPATADHPAIETKRICYCFLSGCL